MQLTNQLLSSKAASEELRKLGLRVSHTTLAKWRSQGEDSPAYYLFGRAVYYCPSELKRWAAYRLSKRRHTSEHPRPAGTVDVDIFKALGLDI